MMVIAALLPAGVLAAGGNDGTLKIHEEGTPSGTESNDPKVCRFNVEGFGFDEGQTGYLMFDVQGGDAPTGVGAGPYSWGPADSDGFYATQYFDLQPGHYKATLYGKQGPNGALEDVKAKSKVFKVQCAAATPTPTPAGTPTPTPAGTPTPTPAGTPTPTPAGTPTPTPAGTPTPTPAGTPTPTPVATPTPQATPVVTPTPAGGVGGATGTPRTSTLPPTDTSLSDTPGSASDGWRAILLGLAALMATVLLITPTGNPATRRARRR